MPFFCWHSLPPLAQPAAGHIVSGHQLSVYLDSALGSGSHTVLLFQQEKVCLLLFYPMPYSNRLRMLHVEWRSEISWILWRASENQDVFSRVIVSHVHGCCPLHMNQSFDSGVTLRAPVSLLLLHFPVQSFFCHISYCISLFVCRVSFLFVEN